MELFNAGIAEVIEDIYEWNKLNGKWIERTGFFLI